MPHFKCVACEMRLSTKEGPAGGVGDLCPGCGSLLEPVTDLSKIVGFQSIKPRDRADQARLEVQRWLDDGGSFDSAALAETMALPARREDL